VQALLNDPRVDPSVDNNKLLQLTNGEQKDQIVQLLLQHPKVKQKQSEMDSTTSAEQYAIFTGAL
jgi:hypothetical protein